MTSIKDFPSLEQFCEMLETNIVSAQMPEKQALNYVLFHLKNDVAIPTNKYFVEFDTTLLQHATLEKYNADAKQKQLNSDSKNTKKDETKIIKSIKEELKKLL